MCKTAGASPYLGVTMTDPQPPVYNVGDRVWYDGAVIGAATVTAVDDSGISIHTDSGSDEFTSWPHLTPLADHQP